MDDNVILDVIVPCYNAEKYIADALRSIQNQTFKEYNVIVIDDASTDKSYEIIEKFAKDDPRIRGYRNSSNMGVANVRNKGISLCKSKYIAFMDADDVSDAKRFEIQIAFLEQHPDIGAVSAGYYSIDCNGNKMKSNVHKSLCSSEIAAALIFSDVFYNAIAMFRREIVCNNNIVYKEQDVVAEDYRFWVEFCRYSGLFVLEERLYYYRQLNTGLTQTYADSGERKKTLDEIHNAALEYNGFTLSKEQREIFNSMLYCDNIAWGYKQIQLLKETLKCIIDQSYNREKSFRDRLKYQGRILYLNICRNYLIRKLRLQMVYTLYRKWRYGEK